MRAVSIDPGINGAVAIIDWLNRPKLRACIDVPVRGEGSGKRPDATKLLAFLAEHYPIDLGFIERAQAMPSLPDAKGNRRGMGASSSFNYGRTVGYLECCIVGLDIPLKLVESSAWKRTMGLLKQDKEASRQCAIRQFDEGGEKFFARKLDHNRAESALIGLHGLLLHYGITDINAMQPDLLRAG